MNKRKPILILGSNSFSGSNFIDQLLLNGSKVIGISRSIESASVFRTYKARANSNNFEFRQIDINDSPESISEIVRAHEIEYVYNFMAQSMVSESWASPEHWYKTNVMSISKLANLLREMQTIKKFVHFTTPEVYGSTNGWIKESFDFAPSTPYAISRAAGDWHLRALFLNYGFPVIFTRASNVYGPGQDLYRIIPKTILSALTGKKLALHGGGESKRSFIHIDDVSTALIAIMENGKIGHTYHISTNEVVSIFDLVKTLATLLKIEVKDFTEHAAERMGKDSEYQLSSEKIRTELRWNDQITLKAGLIETISWVRSNLETLRELPMSYEHKR